MQADMVEEIDALGNLKSSLLGVSSSNAKRRIRLLLFSLGPRSVSPCDQVVLYYSANVCTRSKWRENHVEMVQIALLAGLFYLNITTYYCGLIPNDPRYAAIRSHNATSVVSLDASHNDKLCHSPARETREVKMHKGTLFTVSRVG